MIQNVAFYCLVFLFLAIGLNLIRLAKGPSLADRAVSADAIFLNLIGISALYSVWLGTPLYFDLVLVFSLVGFVGTICFAKFLSRGKLIE